MGFPDSFHIPAETGTHFDTATTAAFYRQIGNAVRDPVLPYTCRMWQRCFAWLRHRLL